MSARNRPGMLIVINIWAWFKKNLINMRGINIYETFLRILYAKNRYKWLLYDNQFQSKILIYANQNTWEWDRWNSIPIFPIEAITLWFVFLLILAIITIFKPTFYYSILYLANIVLG